MLKWWSPFSSVFSCSLLDVLLSSFPRFFGEIWGVVSSFNGLVNRDSNGDLDLVLGTNRGSFIIQSAIFCFSGSADIGQFKLFSYFCLVSSMSVFLSSFDRVLELRLSRGWIVGFSWAVCVGLFNSSEDRIGSRDFGKVVFSGEVGSLSFKLKENSFILPWVIAVPSSICSGLVLAETILRDLRGWGSCLLMLESLELQLEPCLRIPFVGRGLISEFVDRLWVDRVDLLSELVDMLWVDTGDLVLELVDTFCVDTEEIVDALWVEIELVLSAAEFWSLKSLVLFFGTGFWRGVVSCKISTTLVLESISDPSWVCSEGSSSTGEVYR